MSQPDTSKVLSAINLRSGNRILHYLALLAQLSDSQVEELHGFVNMVQRAECAGESNGHSLHAQNVTYAAPMQLGIAPTQPQYERT
jgi:hypothetical protein